MRKPSKIRRRRQYEKLFAHRPAFLTTAELEADMGLSRGTICSLRARGVNPIPCVKLGNRIKFPKTGLIEWLVDNEILNGEANSA